MHTCDGQRQTPSPGVDVIGAEVDEASSQDTNGDEELEQDVHGSAPLQGMARSGMDTEFADSEGASSTTEAVQRLSRRGG